MANLQTGRDARLVGNHVPKEESGRRAISCPLTVPWTGARYDILIDVWAHESRQEALCHFQ